MLQRGQRVSNGGRELSRGGERERSTHLKPDLPLKVWRGCGRGGSEVRTCSRVKERTRRRSTTHSGVAAGRALDVPQLDRLVGAATEDARRAARLRLVELVDAVVVLVVVEVVLEPGAALAFEPDVGALALDAALARADLLLDAPVLADHRVRERDAFHHAAVRVLDVPHGALAAEVPHAHLAVAAAARDAAESTGLVLYHGVDAVLVALERGDEGLGKHAVELGGRDGARVLARAGERVQGRVEVALDRGGGGRRGREVLLEAAVHRLDLLRAGTARVSEGCCGE